MLLEIWLPNLRTNEYPRVILLGLYRTLHEMYESIKNKLVSKNLMDPEKERDENDYYDQRGG